MVADAARADRSARVRQILDEAAGSAQPGYDGQGRFWERGSDELAGTSIYGIAMIAAPGTPSRGASSGLVRGLRGAWPFDGTQFPRLPWGGDPVSAADIELIAGWIDDGLPDTDPPDPDPAKPAAGGACCVEVLPPAQPPDETDDPNAHRERIGAIKARHDVEHLSPTELANLRAAIAELRCV